MSVADWRERLFGASLVRCDSSNAAGGQFETVATTRALEACGAAGGGAADGDAVACGVYFSFANISEASDDFPRRLAALFEKVRRRLRVVQVVLWAHGVSCAGVAERELAFRRSIAGRPWFAVPFHDVDTKRRLTRKFDIAVGVPALVLVEGARGRHVRDALLADPAGEHFPWTPPAVHEILKNVPLESCDAPGDDKKRGAVLYSELPDDAVRLFYFAAHWCPPCRSFAPALCGVLAAVRRRARHAHAQLIIVSSDRSAESFARTCAGCGAAGARAVPWGAAGARRALAAALGVAGIPALVLLDAGGRTLTDAGRAALAADPEGMNFPWGPRLVTVLTEQCLQKMAQHPTIILFIDDEDSELEFAESVLLPAAESYFEECSIQYPGFCPYQSSSDDESIDFDYPTSARGASKAKRKSFRHTLFLVGVDGTDSADMLREHTGLDDAVPLLAAVDFPRRRMTTMKYGDEITTLSVQNFVDSYLSGNIEFQDIKPFSEKC